MGMTAEDRRRLKGRSSPEALGVKPDEAARMLGESRNTVYRLLASGELKAVKRGVSTLVLVTSIREYFNSLPPATFRAADAAAENASAT